MPERKHLLIRINPRLWEDLNRWAGEDLRSVNAQIEFILQRAVDERYRRARRRGSPPEVDDHPAEQDLPETGPHAS